MIKGNFNFKRNKIKCKKCSNGIMCSHHDPNQFYFGNTDDFDVNIKEISLSNAV